MCAHRELTYLYAKASSQAARREPLNLSGVKMEFGCSPAMRYCAPCLISIQSLTGNLGPFHEMRNGQNQFDGQNGQISTPFALHSSRCSSVCSIRCGGGTSRFVESPQSCAKVSMALVFGQVNLLLNLGSLLFLSVANLSTSQGCQILCTLCSSWSVMPQSSKSTNLDRPSAMEFLVLHSHFTFKSMQFSSHIQEIPAAIGFKTTFIEPFLAILAHAALSEYHRTSLSCSRSLKAFRPACMVLAYLHVELFICSCNDQLMRNRSAAW